MITKPQKRAAWQTVRCVVEYRTNSGMSERQLARTVQSILDTSAEREHSLSDSRVWAKQFSASIARLTSARPRRLRAAVRALDAVANRLRKL